MRTTAKARRMLWPVMICMLILSIVGMSAGSALAGPLVQDATPTPMAEEEPMEEPAPRLPTPHWPPPRPGWSCPTSSGARW